MSEWVPPGVGWAQRRPVRFRPSCSQPGKPGPRLDPQHAHTHRVSVDTLASIYSQECQYRVIKSHHVHKAHMGAYCAR